VKLFKRIRRAEDATLTEAGLLLFIAQNVDASGLYQYTDADTADATYSTKPTVQRLRHRLTVNGYLVERRPTVWLGRNGWSTVGVEITSKGLKKIIPNTKLSQVTNPDSNTLDPNSNESMTICNRLPVKKEIVDYMGYKTIGISPDESGLLIDRTVRLVLDAREYNREMAELAASHWGRVILTDAVTIIQPEPVVLVGTTETPATLDFANGQIISADDWDRLANGGPTDGIPICACGEDLHVRFSFQRLNKDEYKLFLKHNCALCAERNSPSPQPVQPAQLAVRKFRIKGVPDLVEATSYAEAEAKVKAQRSEYLERKAGNVSNEQQTGASRRSGETRTEVNAE
jgi:hypothetical protein